MQCASTIGTWPDCFASITSICRTYILSLQVIHSWLQESA